MIGYGAQHDVARAEAPNGGVEVGREEGEPPAQTAGRDRASKATSTRVYHAKPPHRSPPFFSVLPVPRRYHALSSPTTTIPTVLASLCLSIVHTLALLRRFFLAITPHAQRAAEVAVIHPVPDQRGFPHVIRF